MQRLALHATEFKLKEQRAEQSSSRYTYLTQKFLKDYDQKREFCFFLNNKYFIYYLLMINKFRIN